MKSPSLTWIVVCWALVLHAQIDTGNEVMCGLRENSSVACWGRVFTEDGDLSTVTRPPAGQFLSVSVGETHACAILINGDATCWGEGESGQLSYKEAFITYTNPDDWLEWDDDLDDDKDLSEGYTYDDDWRLEMERQKDLDAEREAAKEQPTFLQISAGFKHTCAVQNGSAIGELKCWGP